MPASNHSIRSAYRENLLEHLFAGAIMKDLWLSGVERVEMLKPQVDDGGYDLVLEADGVVRHVQLKATFRGSKVARFNINSRLAEKPSGCVVVVLFEPATLELGPFLWYGGKPGKRLRRLLSFPIAKHTKANAKGVKLPRKNIRCLPRRVFSPVADIVGVVDHLFPDRRRRRRASS